MACDSVGYMLYGLVTMHGMTREAELRKPESFPVPDFTTGSETRPFFWECVVARYFWLKLASGFFDTEEVKVVQCQDNGDKYLVFWLKLLLKAIQQTDPGRLRFRDTIPYTDKLLSDVLSVDIDVVRSGMKLFQEIGILKIVEDGTIWIEDANKMIGSEGDSAERVRQFRIRQDQALLQCNDAVTAGNNCNVQSSTELELELELEKEKKVSTPSAPKRNTASVPKVDYIFDTGMFQNISDKQVETWGQAYPALEIEVELAKASAWLKANPNKSKKNYHRFLVNWFSRAQEKGGDRKYAARR